MELAVLPEIGVAAAKYDDHSIFEDRLLVSLDSFVPYLRSPSSRHRRAIGKSRKRWEDACESSPLSARQGKKAGDEDGDEGEKEKYMQSISILRHEDRLLKLDL